MLKNSATHYCMILAAQPTYT
ncbi:hypothetical protein A5834_001674, partial [Enterococcus faecium]